MRLLTCSLALALAFLTLTTATAQRNTAGLTIPARQTFLLGEYADYPYRADLKNVGRQPVTAQLRDKDSKAVAKTLTVAPGDKVTVEVAASQEVALENANDRRAKVDVTMSREVVGMRYVGNGDVALPQPDVSKNVTAADAVPGAGAPRRTVATTIKRGRALVLGEGTVGEYAAVLMREGGRVEVSVRDRKTGAQTQGFGLGDRATVYIAPHEVIYLVNAGLGRASVRVEFSEPVGGMRVVRE